MKRSQPYITCVCVHFSFEFHMKQTWLFHRVCTIVQFSSLFMSREKITRFHQLTLLCWSEASGWLWIFWSPLYKGRTTSLQRGGWKWERKRWARDFSNISNTFNDCKDSKLTFIGEGRHSADTLWTFGKDTVSLATTLLGLFLIIISFFTEKTLVLIVAIAIVCWALSVSKEVR